MELLVDMGHVESRSVRLEMALLLVQARCMICAKRTIGSYIVLYVPDGTPRSRGSCGISFVPFGDGVLVLVQDSCMDCAKHTIGSDII